MENKTEKLPYKKPELLIIELAVEEVLATGCKNAPGGSGVSGNGCTNPICSITLGS